MPHPGAHEMLAETTPNEAGNERGGAPHTDLVWTDPDVRVLTQGQGSATSVTKD